MTELTKKRGRKGKQPAAVPEAPAATTPAVSANPAVATPPIAPAQPESAPQPMAAPEPKAPDGQNPA